MITRINESQILTNHILCEYKCRFDGKKCNSHQWLNNDECWCEYKKGHVCEKDYAWNPVTCNCKNGKYLASTTDDSAIMWDEVIESYDVEIKTVPTNFNEINIITCRTQNSCIWLAFLLITIELLTNVIIYC